MTNKEAIANLNHIYGIVSSDIQRSLDLAIKALEQQLKCGCNTCEYYPMKDQRPQGDLMKAFELLKAHCKNRECNKDCVFYRELRAGNDIEQFCGLCEIVMSDDKEVKKNDNSKT